MKKLMFAAAVVGAMVMSAEAGYTVTQWARPYLPSGVSGAGQNITAVSSYLVYCDHDFGSKNPTKLAIAEGIGNSASVEDAFTALMGSGTILGYSSLGDYYGAAKPSDATHQYSYWSEATVDPVADATHALLVAVAEQDGAEWACLYFPTFELSDGGSTGPWWNGKGLPGYGADEVVNYYSMAFSETHGTGWVATAAVPEPTSALLMLLGMAGLALKRKVA